MRTFWKSNLRRNENTKEIKMRVMMTMSVLVVATLAITGCTMTRVCNSAGGMEVVQSEGGAASVSVDDACFGEWLLVESSSLRRTGVGFLQALVQIRNVKVDQDDYDRRDDFTLQYRITWFDADGTEIQPDASFWIHKTLHGGESVQLSATAPDKAAVRFVLRARHVR